MRAKTHLVPCMTPGRSAASRSRTGSCSRRWPGSATGSCACRPSATAPAWRCPRWCRRFAIHYGNRKTHQELLTIDPREREGGPVSIQLFGQDPEIMRSAAAHVAGDRRRPHRPQHGLPGSEGDEDGRGRGAAVGPGHRGGGRAGRRRGLGAAGDREAARPRGVEVARRAGCREAGVAGITFHPRTVKVRHKGTPDYELAAPLVESCRCR